MRPSLSIDTQTTSARVRRRRQRCRRRARRRTLCHVSCLETRTVIGKPGTHAGMFIYRYYKNNALNSTNGSHFRSMHKPLLLVSVVDANGAVVERVAEHYATYHVWKHSRYMTNIRAGIRKTWSHRDILIPI